MTIQKKLARLPKGSRILQEIRRGPLIAQRDLPSLSEEEFSELAAMYGHLLLRRSPDSSSSGASILDASVGRYDDEQRNEDGLTERGTIAELFGMYATFGMPASSESRLPGLTGTRMGFRTKFLNATMFRARTSSAGASLCHLGRHPHRPSGQSQ